MSRLHHAATTIRDLAPEKHSLAEVLATLLLAHLHHDPKNPDWPQRDRVIIASESLRPAWFAALVARGLLTENDHHHHRSRGFHLHDQYHQSFATAVAGAVAEAKRLIDARFPSQVFLLLDGEDQSKGIVWESAHGAGHHQLGNLVVIADLDLSTLDTPSVAPHWSQRWESFGWQVIEIDGHSLSEINQALKDARTVAQPVVIIAYTRGER